ncbi:hypothetical protein MTsPCn9_17790 [Croceitalea sp. MTPC9]|nr:hypothetical protein MTsPCn6_10640 [Croceitalea sp. MTPC6]GMN16843.1 hypothetical protein MTsPCn9_17790 [Croceitalea sp. MTPC9]
MISTQKKLGFNIDWIGEGPFFAILSRDNFSVLLRQLKQKNLSRPNRVPFIESGWHTKGQEAWDAYIWVDNADVLFEEFSEKGVSIIKSLQNTEYGNRDFEIEDLDGYILCFGHHRQ